MGKNLRDTILTAVSARGPSKTICPSEVLPLRDRKNLKKMKEVREAARGLIDDGYIVATSEGKIIDIATHRGPIRLRLV